MYKKNKVVNFGCRLNIYESEIIKKNLAQIEQDNIVVFNTCAVTKEAEKQARYEIRKLKKQDQDIKIIVTGCAAQINPGMFSSMPEVDKIIGNEEKLSLQNYLFSTERVVVNDIMSVKTTSNHLIRGFENKSRAFIQVQNGCDHRCTFCIIPYGRGKSRSVPIGEIVKQVKILCAEGYKEVVFTGVDLTSYGSDLPNKPSFAQMIKRVLSLVPNLHRLRLSSIDVAEISEELFDLMVYNKRLMPHFHISVQAGDDMILKRMKRRHTRKQIIDFCHQLRSLRPEISFGADIIAGFPTETEQMFNNTKQLISEAGLQYLHVFPYSERKGTPAARITQLDIETRKARATILRAEGQKELIKFFKKNIGKKVEILTEKNNFAHSENFIPIKLSKNTQSGQLISAKLDKIDGLYMTIRE